jgi:hypothetical protein
VLAEVPLESYGEDVLKWVAGAREPDKLLLEIERAVEWLDSQLRACVEYGKTGADVSKAVRDFQRLHRDRTTAEIRHAEWRQITQSKRPPLEGFTVPDMFRWANGDPTVSRQIKTKLAEAKAKLAQVEHELAALKLAAADDASYYALTIPGNRIEGMRVDALAALGAFAQLKQKQQVSDDVQPLYLKAYRDLIQAPTFYMAFPPRGSQECLLHRAATLLKQKAALKTTIAALEHDARQSVAIVSRRVTRAVENAGGRAAVAESVRACEVVSGRFPPSLAALAAEHATAQAEHAQAEHTLGILAAQAVGGVPLDNAKAAEAKTADKLARVREALAHVWGDAS